MVWGDVREVAAAPEHRPHGLRRSLVRSAITGFVVGLPLLPHPLVDDDRFDPMRWGAEYAGRPSGVIVDQLGLVRFHLTVHGNFRPVGRMVERAQDMLVFVTSDGLGIPVPVALRLWFALSMAVLSVVFVLTIAAVTERGRLRDAGTNRAVLLAPLVLPVLLIAGGRQAPVVNFTDIYLQTMSFVLIVAVVAARAASFTARGVRLVDGSLAAFLGLVVAGFNELGNLAAPLAVVFVVARGLLVLRLPLPEFLRSRPVALTAIGLLGFAVLFVPVRIWLVLHCRTSFCHAPSLVRLSEDTLPLLPQRLFSWVPPAAWSVASADAPATWWIPRDAATVAMILALAVVAAAIYRDLRGGQRLGRPGRHGLFATGAATLALGALLGALSVYVQTRPFELGTGWRDTTLTTVGAGIMLTAGAAWLLDLGGGARRRTAAALVAVLVLGAGVTLMANGAWTDSARGSPQDVVLTRIAVELTHRDPTSEGNRYRCALVDEFLAAFDEDSYEHERLRPAVETASHRSHGLPFCDDLG